MTRYYRFGASVLRLDAPEFPESEQLRRFACRPCKADLSARIRYAPQPVLPAGKARRDGDTERYQTEYGETVAVRGRGGVLLWAASYGEDGCVDCAFSASSGTPLTAFVVSEILDLPRLLLCRGVLVLHASFIEYKGRAILFTAPKRTGKSTQARLWQTNAGAAVINGDRALIERRGGEWYACGLPYSGTSGICRNASFPLEAVVILSQGERNVIRRAASGEAVRALMTGCTYDAASERSVSAFLNAAEPLSLGVPFYKMACLPDASAVECLKNALFARARSGEK